MTIETKLTLEEFWNLPVGETTYEFINGQAVPKVSPKAFQSALQAAFVVLFRSWCWGKGRAYPEWSVALKRSGEDWAPSPDITYISYERLPKSWRRNEACPVPAELVIEIISPGQTLKEFEDKAKDYLAAGVSRVWVVDPNTVSIRAFFPNGQVTLYEGDSKIVDPLLPGFELTPTLVFEEAELID